VPCIAIYKHFKDCIYRWAVAISKRLLLIILARCALLCTSPQTLLKGLGAAWLWFFINCFGDDNNMDI
jgi:hypothetical protein